MAAHAQRGKRLKKLRDRMPPHNAISTPPPPTRPSPLPQHSSPLPRPSPPPQRSPPLPRPSPLPPPPTHPSPPPQRSPPLPRPSPPPQRSPPLPRPSPLPPPPTHPSPPPQRSPPLPRPSLLPPPPTHPSPPPQHSPPLPRPSPPPQHSPPPSLSPSTPIPQPAHEELPSNSPGTYDFSGNKRKRGKSCGKGLHNILEANGGKKMPITFDKKFHVPNNAKVSAFFTSEIGNIIRTSAPVCYIGWSCIPLDDKRKLRESLLVLFDVDLSNEMIFVYVDQKMSKLFAQFKYRLHQHYLSYETPAQGRGNLPNPNLWNGRPESHWHWLCDEVYTTRDFSEISKTNATNRKKQKYHHKGGAKPFIQHAKTNAQNKGVPLSMIDNWENLHKDENGNWINDVAKEKYENMKKMRDVLQEKMIQEAPEGTPLDSVVVDVDAEFRILSEKLGRKGKSIRGVGVFPRMEDSNSYVTSSIDTRFEVNEMQDQLKQLSTNFGNLQKENEELKEQLRAFMSAFRERQQLGVYSNNACYDDLGDHSLDD